MNKSAAVTAVGLTLACLMLGCVSEERQWKEARSANTVEALQAFLTKHAEGRLADSARARIEELTRAVITGRVVRPARAASRRVVSRGGGGVGPACRARGPRKARRNPEEVARNPAPPARGIHGRRAVALNRRHAARNPQPRDRAGLCGLPGLRAARAGPRESGDGDVCQVRSPSRERVVEDGLSARLAVWRPVREQALADCRDGQSGLLASVSLHHVHLGLAITVCDEDDLRAVW